LIEPPPLIELVEISGTRQTDPVIEPFSIDIPQAELDELQHRLTATRWPDHIADDWERGTQPSALRRLIDHWTTEFDWRAVETRVNAHEQVLVDTAGGRIHALLAGDRTAPPLLLLHGWPDSFLRFERLIPLLGDRFRLVIPSIPGFGFSDRPTGVMSPDLVADRMSQLMSALGHETFGVHGGDIGAGVADQLAARHPDRVTGLHFTGIPPAKLASVDPAILTPTEAAWAKAGLDWRAKEGGYIAEQSTKPQTLAAALSDSPAGLASWVLEKFQAWTDGDALEVYDPELLATNATLYWLTGTAGSSVRYYYDMLRAIPGGAVSVPMGAAIFPHDINPAPREFAERFYDIHRWTELDRGGHFAAWEQPQLLADDIRAFFDNL
jgi:pimeloyl-ACP methyl ester carboxylesterase